jgi:hypothetical protein
MKRFLTSLFTTRAKPRAVRAPLRPRRRASPRVECLEARQLLSATLATAVDTRATDLMVQNGASFPTDHFYIRVDNEEMEVITNSVDVTDPDPSHSTWRDFLVLRGEDGTTAQAHNAGAAVNLVAAPQLRAFLNPAGPLTLEPGTQDKDLDVHVTNWESDTSNPVQVLILAPNGSRILGGISPSYGSQLPNGLYVSPSEGNVSNVVASADPANMYNPGVSDHQDYVFNLKFTADSRAPAGTTSILVVVRQKGFNDVDLPLDLVVSGARGQGGNAGVFVLFNGGALWEHTGANENNGWFKIWDTGVKEISASQVQADTVFVLFNGGALWEHVGRDENSGWSKLWDTGVTDISAAVDFSGQPAVFANFSGAVWEHVGTDQNAGWSKVWATGITQMSASQGQANTVFVNFSGAVWEHVGTDQNAGWSKVWDSGVVQISASSAQADTVFVLFNGGAVWEHTGTDQNTGWSKVWDTGVTQISASPVQVNTVFVLFNGGAVWEHVGTDQNAGWSKVWDTGVTQISAAPVQTDTVFVLFDSGAVWEHGGTDQNTGWSKVWDTGVVQISAGLS